MKCASRDFLNSFPVLQDQDSEVKEHMSKKIVPVIVLVEDDRQLVEMYRERFKKENFIVEVASDGDAAIKVINQERPDVVLLDLMLPKKGGINVLQILKTNPETKDIPVIVLTAYPQDEYRDATLRDGATDFISKSEIMPKEVVEKVKKVINWESK